MNRQILGVPKSIQASVTLLENLHIIVEKTPAEDLQAEIFPMLFSSFESTTLQVQVTKRVCSRKHPFEVTGGNTATLTRSSTSTAVGFQNMIIHKGKHCAAAAKKSCAILAPVLLEYIIQLIFERIEHAIVGHHIRWELLYHLSLLFLQCCQFCSFKVEDVGWRFDR